MKKKIFASLVISLAIVISICPSSVFAYTDGDREVDYYDYDLYNLDEGDVIYQQQNPITRQYNRNWVASVSQVSNTKYAITYDTMLAYPNNYAAGKPVSKRGTGNIGNSYYSTSSIGEGVWFHAVVNPKDLQQGVYSRGQWSPDNAR